MSLFRRGNVWYASYSLPGGKRIKESLGTTEKREAQELHDKRKSELWRVDKLCESPDVTFEQACIRWIEEKGDKKSIADDESRIGFWLSHFEGMRLRDITEAKIYSAVSKMVNRRHKENWRIMAESMRRKGKQPTPYVPKFAATATKATHLAFIKVLLRTAEREWKWLDRAPIIKVPQPKNRRIRWLEPSEAERLIDECSEPLKSVVRFALSTGLRRPNIIKTFSGGR